MFIEILAAGDPFSVNGTQPRVEGCARFCSESRLQVPVGSRAKRQSLQFTLDENPNCHRLNSPGRQAWCHFLPKQGAETVAIEPIDNAASFLGGNEVGIEVAGLLDGFLDGLFGDFREHHSLDGHFGLQEFGQMPADTFPFAVLVRRQNEFVGTLEGRLQLGDELLLFLGDDVQGLEVVIDVDPVFCEV